MIIFLLVRFCLFFFFKENINVLVMSEAKWQKKKDMNKNNILLLIYIKIKEICSFAWG